ncbi:apopolysialoglyco-like protein [Phlyctema vagabunda]|uniref:Apopolysialoglyco-like protein n=1 Tax=Phlyctema vagabunda TaxID=108571 RepID=A0ABR4PSD2_9HELO
MAAGYRAGGSSRRTNRTNVANHDILEGIPVRQWRRDYVTVAPQTTQESTTSQNDIWAIELPHGMPKDYLDLPQHSQDLLRAARSGKIYKRPAPVEEEEVDPEVVGEKVDKKEDEPKEKGFTARAWKQVSREAPALDYLAKRRKGIVTAGTKPAASAPVPTVTKATIRRTDAAGNTYVQDMVIASGQKVEGEVISSTTIPDPSAQTPLVEVLPAAVKPRKPTKRKIKGPGRGRKKKLLPPTSAPITSDGGVITPTVEGVAGEAANNGIKKENEDPSGSGLNEDTEMGDGSNQASDDEEGEEGDEGDEEDDGSPDDQGSPVKSTASPAPEMTPSLQATPVLQQDIEMSGTDTASPQPVEIERLKLDFVKAGSPLKNIALTTSSVNSPLPSPSIVTDPPLVASKDIPVIDALLEIQELSESVRDSAQEIAQEPASKSIPERVQETVHDVGEDVVQEIREASVPQTIDESTQAVPMEQQLAPSPKQPASSLDPSKPEQAETTDLPSPPPQATEVHLEAAAEELREEVAEEKAIIDVLEEASAPASEPEIHHEPTPATISAPVNPIAPMEETERTLIEEVPALENSPPIAKEASPKESEPEPPTEATPAATAADDDDDEPKPVADDIHDLLGNLERRLEG